MFAGAIGRDALVQRGGGVVEQLRRAALDLRGLRPLGPEGSGRLRAVGSLYFGRRLTGQIGNVVSLVAAGARRIGAEAGDISGQIPTLAIVQLIGEGRHVGAFDAEPQGAVDPVEAQLIQARSIAQIGRWRGQADTRRAIASACITVAHRTMLGVQGRAASRVGGNDRGLADLVGHSQFRAQLPGLTGDLRAVLTRRDRRMQRTDALLQPGFFRLARHGGDQPLQHPGEFELFAVFRFVNDLACPHRCRVIRADVVEQVQRLRRTFHRVGQQVGAA